MAILNTKFKTYFTEFETEMMKAGSAYDTTINGIKTLFDEFAIPTEERAKYIVQAYLGALQTISTSATQATIAIIAEEKKQDVSDSDIAISTVQSAKDLLVKDAQISLSTKQGLKVDEEKLTQVQTTAKTQNEALKVLRDKQGYDDQMIMKMVEQQANLASFAVNANSTSAQGAIDNLKCLMLKTISRTTALAGETTCTLIA